MSERRGRGRPRKGHVALTIYLRPEVRQLIEEEAARADQTLGEVVATLAGDALPRMERPQKGYGAGESAKRAGEVT